MYPIYIFFYSCFSRSMEFDNFKYENKLVLNETINEMKRKFAGQPFPIEFTNHLNAELTYGTCIPSTCTDQELKVRKHKKSIDFLD